MGNVKKGFILLQRQIMDWEWWDDHNTTRLWITILLLANFEDKEWHGQVIKRGSFFTSLDSLSQKSGLTVRQTRTSLDKLISTGELTSKATSKGRLITVANYDVYQLNVEKATNETTSEAAGKRQTNDKQPDKQATTTNTLEINNTLNNSSSNAREGKFTDIWKALKPYEIDKLYMTFKDAGDLIQEVYEDVRDKGKQILLPYRYVVGYANRVGWERI